jgi:sugar phosphate isomerase/epimerase
MSTIQRNDAGLDRRQFLIGAAVAAAAGALGGAASAAETPPTRTTMGIVTYALGIRSRQNRNLSDPSNFMDECIKLGSGAMQVPLGARDAQYCNQLRQKAENNQFRIEGIITALPQNDAALARFEQEVVAVKNCGATVVRTAPTTGAGAGGGRSGRRYEDLSTAEQWDRVAKNAEDTFQRCEPIMRKHGVRLAVENHKVHRAPEFVALMKKLSSEYVGICVDFGNNFALCEDFMDVVRALAPYAMSAHIKDHQVREYEEGFLLGDAGLGAGFMDLPGMVKVLRDANPKINFSLEVITRDPLRVPVLTPRYWGSMPGVPATDLARTMRTVKLNASRDPLPTVSNLPLDRQVEAESRNVNASIAYAKDKLRLV